MGHWAWGIGHEKIDFFSVPRFSNPVYLHIKKGVLFCQRTLKILAHLNN
jgi:hypothetical protein